ncbi:MAG: hypothetical protein WAM39_18875 [Bryobacteraceae bacterium]
MTKILPLVPALFLLACLVGVAQESKPEGKTTTNRMLKVKLNYTGSGTVDARHKIYAFLFDSPGFIHGSGDIPIAAEAAQNKDGTVTFDAVPTSPVYLSAVYDPAGNYDGQSGPPPSGSSLGLYSKTSGTPEPIRIEPGKTLQVDLAFDDRVKMQ